VNADEGLEHGFTITQRLEGDGPLALHMSIRGDLAPSVDADGRSARFLDATGKAMALYRALKATDADGRDLTARMAAEDAGLRIEVDERGARYPIQVDPLFQDAQFTSPPIGPSLSGDLFGWSVAISHNTVVVGAPQSPPTLGAGPAGAGLAYVFVNSPFANVIGFDWNYQATLSRPGSTEFGTSVGVSGDTIVVGGWGSADVFRQSGGTWSFDASLPNIGSPTSGAPFGFAVAISGDTIVVGGPSEPAPIQFGGLYLGLAYVYVREMGAWSQQAVLQDTTPGLFIVPPGNGSPGFTQTEFGWSVAIDGNTIVIGAPGEQPTQASVYAGAAYVFQRSGTNWVQNLSLHGVGTNQEFYGYSVAVSGNEIAIGAWGTGKVYVVTYSGVSILTNEVVAGDPTQDFGFSVGISGTALAVGAPGVPRSLQNFPTANSPGALYVYSHGGSGWSLSQSLAPDPPSFFFGFNVAMSGNQLVAGAIDYPFSVPSPNTVIEAPLTFDLIAPQVPGRASIFGPNLIINRPVNFCFQPPCLYGVLPVGWQFIPTHDIKVRTILTEFATTANWSPAGPRLVTLQIYESTSAAGTRLVRQASFKPLAGQYSGPEEFGDTLTLRAGVTYLIGYTNTNGLGPNTVLNGTTELQAFTSAPGAPPFSQPLGPQAPVLALIAPRQTTGDDGGNDQ
jgi:hypothetical protein